MSLRCHRRATGSIPVVYMEDEDPLTPALSPRGEGVCNSCGSVPSPLGEKDRMRGTQTSAISGLPLKTEQSSRHLKHRARRLTSYTSRRKSWTVLSVVRAKAATLFYRGNSALYGYRPARGMTTKRLRNLFRYRKIALAVRLNGGTGVELLRSVHCFFPKRAALTRMTDTLPKVLLHNARVFAKRPAIRLKDLGIWQTWTWERRWTRSAPLRLA